MFLLKRLLCKLASGIGGMSPGNCSCHDMWVPATMVALLLARRYTTRRHEGFDVVVAG